MSLPAASGLDIYLGTGLDSTYAGYTAPANYGYKDQIIEGKVNKSPLLETVTINLPRNDLLSHLEIEVADCAIVTAAPAYTVKDPIIFYGSSITEGGCAPRPGTAYSSMLARWLDADHYNYGFSGNARGDIEFAQFIAAHKSMSVFVYDYDHNAPTSEHLQETHRLFFDVVRAAHPQVPIVMLSRPDYDSNFTDSEVRRTIIYDTYNKALQQGDQNVYFVDGRQFFGQFGREECTIDRCHPNALGFFRMAENLYPLMKKVVSLSPLAAR